MLCFLVVAGRAAAGPPPLRGDLEELRCFLRTGDRDREVRYLTEMSSGKLQCDVYQQNAHYCKQFANTVLQEEQLDAACYCITRNKLNKKLYTVNMFIPDFQ